MFKLHWIAWIIIVFNLAGCGPIYKTKYSHVPPTSPAVKACVAHCAKVKEQCTHQCKDEYRTCLEDAHERAVVNYEMYRNHQLIHNSPMNKTFKDFDQSKRCELRCTCDDAFDQCFKSCGGILHPYKVCTAFCEQ